MRVKFVRVVGVVAAALTTVVLAACSSEPQTKPETASDVISSLGAVPIPSASAGTPAPVTASIGHPQLVAMGAPVEVSLPGNVQALVTTSGPASDPPQDGAKPNGAVKGTITVTAKPSAGTVHLAAADLTCRDQSGATVALTPVGPAAATASPGQPATLSLSGTFKAGDAQINWQQDGHVLAIWDFTVEND